MSVSIIRSVLFDLTDFKLFLVVMFNFEIKVVISLIFNAVSSWFTFTNLDKPFSLIQ